MAQCLMVNERGGVYHMIPDTEPEEWSEVLDTIDGDPQLIELLRGWAPYTHAYRMPDGSVYLVAFANEE